MGLSRFITTIGLIGSGAKRARPGKGRGRKTPPGTPRTVGRYRLEEPIGRGSFGEVWQAVDPHISRPVAVKILNIPPGLSTRAKSEWEQRFLREARAAGMLSHPGIVTIHDVGVAEDGRPFIVMEYVDGVGLDAIIDHRRTPRERTALIWGAQVAEALGAAHRRGIVHRDVKPANILIDREGRARIADFGIARLSESELTRDGLFVGSPAFASPEQIRGTEVDGRSDLFSLGSALYTLLRGERPFRGDDLTSLAYAICHVEPAPLRRGASRISPACEAVVMKTLAKDPRDRYQSGEALAEDLKEAAEGRPIRHAVVKKDRVETVVAEEAAEPPEPGTPPPRSRTARPVPGGAAAVAVALVMAVGAVLVVSSLVAGLPAGGSKGPAPIRAAAMPPAEVDPWMQGREKSDAAVVTVHVVNDLPEGVLTLRSGPRRLLRAPLDAGGTGTGWRIRLPEGEHRIFVEVAGGPTGVDLRQEQQTTVRDGRRYRLHVRVKDRPSPRLELMWTDD